jgi:hypothetical protein
VGLQLGTGDQDNYLQLVVSGAGGGSIALQEEVGGSVVPAAGRSVNVTLSPTGSVDLFLAVDAATRTVQPSYQLRNGTTTGPRTNLGTPLTLPTNWFSRAALATGVIATSGGGTTFPATWDMFEVHRQLPQYRPDGRVRLSTVTALSGNDVYNTTGTDQTVSTTAGRGVLRTFVLSVQNDGAVSDSYTLRGPGSSTGFTVRYFAGTTNITTAVVNGTYRMNGVAPGAARSIQMRVTVGSGAAIGSQKSSPVTATSAGTGSPADTVRTVVTVG